MKLEEDSARTTVKHVEASHLFPAYHRYKGPKSDMSMIVQLLRKQVYFWNLQSMKLKTEQLLQLLSRNILLLQLLRRKMIVLQ